jgi:hypothetical protein
MPTVGIDVDAFLGGLGIAEYAVAFVFVFLLGWWVFRRALSLVGW